MSEKSQKITDLRQKLGNQVSILGHHYQHEDVMQHCDIAGDSLELSRRASQIDSEHIVFCGVYFMGESAALLAREGQKIYLPEPDADCVMALMSPASLLNKIMLKLTADGRKLTPLAYVNSSLEVKAVVGKYGGAVCTSANAQKMLDWALKQGDGVIFVPDKNLAQNTAKNLGLESKHMHMLDIRKRGEAVDIDATKQAELLLWPGLCAIHARFMPKHIEALRKKYQGCKIVVHPECSPEMVALADANGSTSFIINYVNKAESGQVIGVGTEINQVRRLANTHGKRGVTVLPLRLSSCSHMAAVTEHKLWKTLEKIMENKAQPIQIAPEIIEHARSTLVRMFEVV